MATLPTVNLIRLQLVEQTHKCGQRSIGKETAAGQRYTGCWNWPRLRTKLGLQLDSSLFFQEDGKI